MIRKIEEKDRETYFFLVNEFYNSDAVIAPVPMEHREATFNELMRSDEYTECFIDEENGEATGFLLISKTFSQEAGGMVVWIEEIYILEQFRGKGIGTKMLEFVQENIPASRYRLEVEPENEGAVKLYKSLGYRWLPYNQMIKGK